MGSAIGAQIHKLCFCCSANGMNRHDDGRNTIALIIAGTAPVSVSL